MDLMKEVTNGNFQIFGVSFIIPLITVAFLTVLISRNQKYWMILPFPLTILINMIGMQIPVVFWIVTGVMFAIGMLTDDGIVNVVSATTRLIKQTATLRSRRQDRRITEQLAKVTKKRKEMKGLDIINKMGQGIENTLKTDKNLTEKRKKELKKEQKKIQEMNRRVGLNPFRKNPFEKNKEISTGLGWSGLKKAEKQYELMKQQADKMKKDKENKEIEEKKVRDRIRELWEEEKKKEK